MQTERGVQLILLAGLSLTWGHSWFVNREFSFSLLPQHANARSSSGDSRRCDKLTEKGISIVLNISLHAISKGIRIHADGEVVVGISRLIDVKDLVCLNNSRITDVRRSRLTGRLSQALLSACISCSLLISFMIQICLWRREISACGRGKRASWSPRNTGALTSAATHHSQTRPACYVDHDERGGSPVAFTEENGKLSSIKGEIFKNLKNLEMFLKPMGEQGKG